MAAACNQISNIEPVCIRCFLEEVFHPFLISHIVYTLGEIFLGRFFKERYNSKFLGAIENRLSTAYTHYAQYRDILSGVGGRGVPHSAVWNWTINDCQKNVISLSTIIYILITYTVLYYITVYINNHWCIARDDSAGFPYSFYYSLYSRLHIPPA